MTTLTFVLLTTALTVVIAIAAYNLVEELVDRLHALA